MYKKLIVFLVVLAMTVPCFGVLTAGSSFDGVTVLTAWGYTASTSTLYSWGQGTFSVTGDGGNGYGFPADEHMFQGAMATGGNTRLYHHNYNHATQPIFDLTQPGTFSTWVSPNWNGVNQGGSQFEPGTYHDIVVFGANEFAGPLNLFLFSNGVQPAQQLILSYDGGTGIQVLENHTYMTDDWTLGSWHHILMTWDNSSLTVGMDGNVLYSVAHNPALFTSAQTAGGYFYGRGTGGPDAVNGWDGWVDGLAIYVGETVPTAGGTYQVPTFPPYWPPPGRATNPDPCDLETGVNLDIELSWAAGEHTYKHEMYFDSNEANVAERLVTPVTLGYGQGSPNSCSPPIALELGVTYYWAVDEIGIGYGPGGELWWEYLTPGDLWQFTTAYIYRADFDETGYVDGFDYAIFANAWQSTQGQGRWNPLCDISEPADEVIDEFDLMIFVNDWLWEE